MAQTETVSTDAQQRRHRPSRYVPDPVREEVLSAVVCYYCGDILLPREVEHHIPVSRGGTSDITNLVAACVSCNSQKGALNVHEWRAYRQGHGMPWPPLASHATALTHYSSSCNKCRSAQPRADWPEHRYLVIPEALHVVRHQVIEAWYVCLGGHGWTAQFTVDDSYYTDCPCAFCVAGREDDRVPHATRPLRWNEPPNEETR